MSAETISVRELRRLWKPHKERLQGADAENSTNVRFHRACSWLARAETAGDDDLDVGVLCRWIAFNALYGQWDHAEREPVADIVCWKHFIERMLELDRSGHIEAALADHKSLVMAIFDDEFLSRYFWQDPTDKRANQSRKTKFEARTWFLQGNWLMILDRLLERIYFLRCQLAHGASTCNSSLNRTALRRCSTAFDRLLRAFLLVWIHHGADENWGMMCYPPLTLASASSHSPVRAGKKIGSS